MSTFDLKLGCYSYLLKILILTIAVCEFRRGFALQCFHCVLQLPAVVGGARSTAQETAADCEVGMAGEHEVGVAAGVEEEDVMEWFKGLDDSDLTSFDDFEED